ncbi:MAG: hypothetical protein CMF76_01960 [Maricaulis sp.]|uniref:UrcA family protein n=1 Tax=Maricaulis virginensis TaxID=144022 RepID=UPI000C68BE75|nr:hypothetical protein [Oceanicaulis sp.]MAZ90719.1 hypothetical protein [Maricaulis sp.]
MWFTRGEPAVPREVSTMLARILVSVSVVLAAGSAAWTDDDDHRSQVITVRPFELADPVAREELQVRIENAIESVCRFSGQRDLASLNNRRRCRTETRESVESQLGFPIAELKDRHLDRQLALHLTSH